MKAVMEMYHEVTASVGLEDGRSEWFDIILESTKGPFLALFYSLGVGQSSKRC